MCVIAKRILQTGRFYQLRHLGSHWLNGVWHRSLSSNHRPRLTKIHQGEKVHGVFSKEEFSRRQDRLRLFMAINNITAALFTSYHNINYYSGFMYCSFGRNYGLLVTHDDVTVISSSVDGGQPWRRSLGASECITYTDWQADNFFYAVQTLAADIEGAIGMEFDNITMENTRKFDACLPDNEKVDISPLVRLLRIIKSDEELNVIQHGARIADLGGHVARSVITEGIPESEVAMMVTEAMNKEINKTFPLIEQMDTWTWLQSGVINSDGAHNPATNRRIQKGDILGLACSPMIAGYYTALERTMFYGHATDDNIRLWEMNCDVHRRGLELIQPGTRCCDITDELNDIYRQYGLLECRSFGYGHSFGALSHYYGRESDVELREDNMTVLVPRMVISMEPMIMVPESLPGAGGYKEHDVLFVTEHGADRLTQFPFGPEHNIIPTS